MYKILIVDDEELVRRSIIKIVDWNILGFSEVYEAENGVQALELALSISPQLVLTDIRMPFMDGLDLARAVREKLPSTHVVILSGHDEFKYAQKAIELGILDYILKPLGAATLTKKMKEIRKRLDYELHEKEYLIKIKSQLHQSLPVLREGILNTLVCTQGMKHGIENRLTFLEIQLDDGPFVVGVIEPDLSGIPPSDAEIYSFAVKNITLETLGSNHLIFSESSGKVVIVFCMSSLPPEANHRSNIIEILNVIQKSINVHLKIPTTFGLGTAAADTNSLYPSYKEALTALDCKYTLGKDKIYDILDLDYMQIEFFYPFDASSEFLTAVKTCKTNMISETLSTICSLLKSRKNLSAANIKLMFIELITSLLKLLTETKQMPAKVWSNGLSLYSRMEQLGTVDEMASAIKGFAILVSKELAEMRTNSSQSLVYKAMDYIKDNYHREELSLQTAAVHTSVSTGYLSALFKKEAGVNFSDYVTRIRMEKAMELLRTTDLKTYEVAYRTGFSNPHYFSISFRKYSGMSPSEFRGELEE